ncbi:MAG: hypothetical protein ACXAEI_00965 [Candidatus Hodarchaeales archaeon]
MPRLHILLDGLNFGQGVFFAVALVRIRCMGDNEDIRAYALEMAESDRPQARGHVAYGIAVPASECVPKGLSPPTPTYTPPAREHVECGVGLVVAYPGHPVAEYPIIPGLKQVATLGQMGVVHRSIGRKRPLVGRDDTTGKEFGLCDLGRFAGFYLHAV